VVEGTESRDTATSRPKERKKRKEMEHYKNVTSEMAPSRDLGVYFAMLRYVGE